MAASPRLTARNIKFTVDGDEFSCDANKISLTTEDAPGGVRTFCETNVEKQWKMAIDGIVSLSSTSLYQTLFALQGTQVDFVLAPAGNATASPTQPHYGGSVIIDEIPPMELTAGEGAVFSVTLTVDNATHNPAGGVWYGLEKITA